MATKLALSLERRFYLKRKAAPERLLVARIPCLLAFCCISVAPPSSNAPQLPWSRSGSGSSAACTSWRLSLRARNCFQPQFRNDYVSKQERIALTTLSVFNDLLRDDFLEGWSIRWDVQLCAGAFIGSCQPLDRIRIKAAGAAFVHD
jgi:hypothetical protein